MTTPTPTTTRHNLRQTDFLPARFSGARLDRNDSTAHFLTFTDYLDAHDIDTTEPTADYCTDFQTDTTRTGPIMD